MPAKKFAPMALIALLFSAPLFADDAVEAVIEGCAPEIEAYCSQVNPGEGRLAACFYAHEDKLSSNCLNSLYDAALALEAAIETFANIAQNCDEDIEANCADVEMGEGRILRCLSASRDSISAECKAALDAPEE